MKGSLLILLCISFAAVAFGWKSGGNLRKEVGKCIVGASLLVGTSIVTPSNVLAADAPQKRTPPQVFGLKKGRLLPCRQISNCISTSSINSVEKYSRPWAFSNDAEVEFKDLVNAVQQNSQLKVVEINEDNKYIHATAKSAVPPTGTDDVEFLLNPTDKIIAYRSNSRETVGGGGQIVGDGGSNRNRLESIKRKLGVAEMSSTEGNDDYADYVKSMQSRQLFQQMQAASQPNDVNFLDNSVPTAESAPTAQSVPSAQSVPTAQSVPSAE